MRGNLGAILVVLGALVVFGYFYNRFVAWMEGQGYDEGYTAYLVVGGVMVTEISAAIMVYLMLWRGICVMGDDALAIATESLGLHLLAYLASGLPMIVGATLRHAQERRAGQDSLRQQ